MDPFLLLGYSPRLLSTVYGEIEKLYLYFEFYLIEYDYIESVSLRIFSRHIFLLLFNIALDWIAIRNQHILLTEYLAPVCKTNGFGQDETLVKDNE